MNYKQIPSNNQLEINRNTQIKRVQISKLKPFDKQLFKSYSSEKLQGLAESIHEQGVIVPILVRPIKHERYAYEIVSGHNRIQASMLAGINDIPCHIRELDDNTAIILMIDSNLQQRETILPSEKAFAYKLKLEAIRAQGKRNDLTSLQVAWKSEAADFIGENQRVSGDTIRRYIRLTNLLPQLLAKADERKLAFIPAVELSYLKVQEQKDLYNILSREEKFGVPLKQAALLKGISQNGKLSYDKIDKIILQQIKKNPKSFKIPYRKVDDYFAPETTPKEFEDTIVSALDLWFKRNPKKRNKETGKER